MYQLPSLRPRDVLIYLRKSRADDPLLSVEEVLSKHEEMLDEFCRRAIGDLIPKENRFREVVSGETIESRPEMQKVLRLIEQPQYKAILCVEPQRLSRGDLEDIGRISKILRYTKTLVITLQYVYDPTDARDREDLERELKRGNEYLEYTKRIMNNGRILSVKRGNYIGNVAPYGYKKIAVKEDRQTVYTLEPEPTEAPYVKMIFELNAAGKGATTIANKLDALGAPTRKGTRWTTATIVSILKNPHYLGLVYWGRRKGVTTVEEGELRHSRPWNSEYMTAEGKHPALISKELWDMVRSKKPTPKNKTGHELHNILSGMIFCQCGYAMVYRQYKNKEGANRSAPRLLCNDQRHCHGVSCTFDEAIEAVEYTLKAALKRIDLLISKSTGQSVDDHAAEITALKKRIKNLEDLEYAYWDKYAKEGMPQHVFDALNKKRLSDLDDAREELEKLQRQARAPEDLHDKRAALARSLVLLKDPDADSNATNALLRTLIKRITYTRTDRSKPASFKIDLDI